jgi:hypothetical protein
MNTLSNLSSRLALPAQPTPVWRHALAVTKRCAVSVWGALEEHGHRRAAHELRRVAERVALSDPALARALREASRHHSREPQAAADRTISRR